ncbi:hypothetical protein BKA62DRAFT_828634 [Auriculariales sp. MPI-PUGE-AT-0066]|nr:hypothetical protein BKA62DRAFT_828634 [Auriculariales sp. MPI-PUGE-AT-0066]
MVNVESIYTPTAMDSLRCAVALAILAAQPKDRSLASFILDVRKAFPVQDVNKAEDDEWRLRALATEADLDALNLELDSVRAELRELKQKRAHDEVQEISAPPTKKRKKAPVKADKEPSTPKQQLAQSFEWSQLPGLHGGPNLIESLRIVQSFERGSQDSLVNARMLLVRVAQSIPTASSSAFQELAKLIQDIPAVLKDRSMPVPETLQNVIDELDSELAHVAALAVRRMCHGTLEAKHIVTSVLSSTASNQAATVVLLEATRALATALASLSLNRNTANRTVSSTSTTSLPRSARLRISQKDVVVTLCLAVHASLDAGATPLSSDDCALLEVVELAGRAGPVVYQLVLAAVERAWLCPLLA